MISEKTVELNLTTEFLNFAGLKFKKYFYVIAPSQRAEAKLGYDVGIYGNGGAILIQYKRAYVKGESIIWHINHTKNRDQHSRLLRIEKSGFTVFYALPKFFMPHQIVQNRRRLLLQTAWIRPSKLIFSGNINEQHDVCWNKSNDSWWTNSPTSVELPKPDENINIVIEELEKASANNNLENMIRMLNTMLLDSESGEPLEHIDSELFDILDSQSLLVQPEK